MNTISQMFVCVQAFLLLSAGLTAASEPAARKPNIILIMADDASDTVFGSYGSSHFSTPKLDAIALEGLRFNHGYSVNLCVPTRVEILTGKYSHRNFLGKGTLAKGERTIAHVLKAQGYRTCVATKWQVSVRRGQKPAEAGFDQWCYNAGPADFYWDPKIDQDGTIRSLPGEYGPDVYLNYVRQFVEDNRDRPFFVFYAMHLPHGPNHWPPAADGSRPDLPNPDDPLARNTRKWSPTAMGSLADYSSSSMKCNCAKKRSYCSPATMERRSTSPIRIWAVPLPEAKDWYRTAEPKCR